MPTVWLCCALVAAAYGSAWWLTRGFAVWTAEGARRLAVAEQPVATPHAVLRGSGVESAAQREVDGVDLAGLLMRPGRVTLVNFVYTRCASVCLAMGTEFAQLQRVLADSAMPQPNVQLLSISFDPLHDDAAALQRAATRWGADPRHWRFASVPDATELQRLLAAFQVTLIADGLGGYEHNAALLVIDENGRLVQIFEVSETDAALAYARWLLQHGSSPA
jgi:protein SCO1